MKSQFRVKAFVVIGLAALGAQGAWASSTPATPAEAKAPSKLEVCKASTTSKKSYNICVEFGTEQEQLASCAKVALYKDNTFKTVPFKKCLKASRERNLTVEAVEGCGYTSATHVSFLRCIGG